MKLKLIKGTHGQYAFYCPACKDIHCVWTDPRDGVHVWGWNKNKDKPTFTPSIKVLSYTGQKVTGICHSFVKDGKIQYLEDCTHKMAGNTVELPDIPKKHLNFLNK